MPTVDIEQAEDLDTQAEDLDLELEVPDDYESPAVHIRAGLCPENCY